MRSVEDFSPVQERKAPILIIQVRFFDLKPTEKEPTEREIELLEVPYRKTHTSALL